MSDEPIDRPKRRGNYTPDRIKVLEPEIAAKYAADQSAKSLGREYGISKNTVLRIAATHGVPVRGKKEAGKLLRRIDTALTPEEVNDNRSIAQQVAEKLGLGSSNGLSSDRAFRTACAKERRRRSPDLYRAIDSRRKETLNRIPAWANREKIRQFYQMARDLGLTVDHGVPLKNDLVCGLHVENNLTLLSGKKNHSKGNKFVCGPDPFIGPPKLELLQGSNRGSTVADPR